MTRTASISGIIPRYDSSLDHNTTQLKETHFDHYHRGARTEKRDDVHLFN